MPELKSKPEFKAGVGLSRKWDAREAGREVALTTLEKLGDKKPDFFLLFSTIHYEKYGGFQEFLAGVWDILPEGTPLIGGTVAGFIIPQGCFTRGATALAVSYPNMDVAVGYGKNTKRAPHLAAKQCAEMIKRGLRGSRYENKFIFSLISGPTMPIFPIFGKKFVIKSKAFGFLTRYLMDVSVVLLQKGYGREDEVLNALSKLFPDFYFLVGSSSDDNNVVDNYQFFMTNCLTNSVVALALKIDLSLDIVSAHGFKEREICLNVTSKSSGGRIINKLDNSPAVDRLLKVYKWPSDFLEGWIHRKTFFCPLGFRNKDNMLCPAAIGAIMGNSFSFSYGITNNELHPLTASGRDLVDVAIKSISKNNQKSQLALVISCCARLVTLGEKINYVYDNFKTSYGKKPFLVLYGLGEGVYLPDKSPMYLNESFNICTFG